MQIDDWDCGRHSGISTCCIIWYMGPWQKIMTNIPKLWRMYYTMNETEKAEYIRCPMCILRNRMIELKECECDASR